MKDKHLTILVTGAGGSAAFNFIDSLRLAKTPFTIIGVDSNRYHLALSNADFVYHVPSCSQNEDYIKRLNMIIDKHDVDLIHPQPDVEVAFLARHREKLHAKVFLPSTATVMVCQDKAKTNILLKRAGIQVAESYKINSKEELIHSFNRLQKKSGRLWLRAIHGAGSNAALPVAKVTEAEFWIKYWKRYKNIGWGDFMLAEFLPGKEFAFQSLWDQGKLVSSQARERMEYVFGNLTVSGQSSSPAVAMTVQRSDVNETASRAILAIDSNATGVFCVDLKSNQENIPCVIEINAGRFFTTSNFFAHAGLNMPFDYITLALGKKLHKRKPFNGLPTGYYWIRTIDMGYKLVKEKKDLPEISDDEVKGER